MHPPAEAGSTHLPAEAGTWPRIPGYDSGSDSEDAEEADILSIAEDRLQMIIKILGDRWIDYPFLDFVPAPKPLKDSMPFRHHPPHPRLWGPNGLPPAFRLEHVDAPIVRETFISNGLCQTQEKDWLVQWCGPSMKASDYATLHEYQRVNHFPGSTELTRKDRMWKHLAEIAQSFGKDSFGFVPETFVLPEQIEEFLSIFNRTKHLWIVKPSASSRGRGIFILRDIDELPLDEVSVVSRYVDKPLLIQGLKFDLRVYVLVTSFEPLRAYVYREGLTRFASSPYSTEEEHLQDAYRHLTNYSINKSAENFVENQEVKADNVGHKWSLSALNKHLKCVGIDVELMWTRILDLILKTLLAVEPVIGTKLRKTASHRTNCFELYGFDVLVDERLKPWLLEVNLSPSMQADSPLDWQVKSSLLCDTFNLVGVHDGRQASSTSRLRSRLMEMRRSSANFGLPGQLGNPGVGRRRPASPSMKSTWPPPHRARSSVAGVLLGGTQAVVSALPAAADLEQDFLEKRETRDTPVVLDMLTEGHLKTLANAMREVPRRHNFIRLFPTRRTVEKYAPLCEPRSSRTCECQSLLLPCRASGGRLSPSQILASVLFGPAPIRSLNPIRSRSTPMFRSGRMTLPGASPGRHAEMNGSHGGEGADTEESPRAFRMSQQASMSRMNEASKLLRHRSGHRMLLMEYLIRVEKACKSLGACEKAKLALGGEVSARLASFRQQLQGIMRKSASSGMAEDAEFRAEWMLLALTRCPVGSNEGSPARSGATGRHSSSSRPTLSDSGGDAEGLIDELGAACRESLLVLVQDMWLEQAPNSKPPCAEDLVARSADTESADDSKEMSLEFCVPPVFSQSAAGQRALDIVPNLSAAELERVLQAPKLCAPSSSSRGDVGTASESMTRSFGSLPFQSSGPAALRGGYTSGTMHGAAAVGGGPVPSGGSRPAESSTKWRPSALGPYTLPNGGSRRMRAEAPRHGDSPTSPAERAHAVLASSVVARTELPPRPYASAPRGRPQLSLEVLTPLRYRSSSSLKMRLSRPTVTAEKPAPLEMVQLHASRFNAEIEL